MELQLKLIENVKKYDVLYNNRSIAYRDRHIREETWHEIGKTLKVNADTAKNTWEKLRRCYLNALNRRRHKKSTKKNIPWRYSKQMSFLLPYLEHRKPAGQLLDKMKINVTQPEDISMGEECRDDELIKVETDFEFHENELAEHQIDHNRIENAAFTKQNYEQNHSDNPSQFDHSDMFYLSMSKMAKRLPLVVQAKIKLDLTKSVLEAEMRVEEEKMSEESSSRPSSSSRADLWSVKDEPV